MITGSLCLTEILKSWKPCSSNSEASQTADSTRASGGLAVLTIAGYQGPALTPIRMDVPWSFAALAISLTWSSNLRMLPGLTRTAQPASIAAKTPRLLEVDVRDPGIWDFGDDRQRLGVRRRTGRRRGLCRPEPPSSAICCSVALMSVVGVVVMDWTLMGKSGADPHGSHLDLARLPAGGKYGGRC